MNPYNSIVLTIIALVLLFIGSEIVKLNDNMSDKIEKNIHFNRWYDVSMFKGTQINIDETKSWSPFDDRNMITKKNKNMMDGTHLNLTKKKGEK